MVTSGLIIVSSILVAIVREGEFPLPPPQADHSSPDHSIFGRSASAIGHYYGAGQHNLPQIAHIALIQSYSLMTFCSRVIITKCQHALVSQIFCFQNLKITTW